MEKITTIEEYELALKEKSEIKDSVLQLKFEMLISRNDPEKMKLLEEKNNIIQKNELN